MKTASSDSRSTNGKAALPTNLRRDQHNRHNQPLLPAATPRLLPAATPRQRPRPRKLRLLHEPRRRPRFVHTTFSAALKPIIRTAPGSASTTSTLGSNGTPLPLRTRTRMQARDCRGLWSTRTGPRMRRGRLTAPGGLEARRQVRTRNTVLHRPGLKYQSPLLTYTDQTTNLPHVTVGDQRLRTM